MQTTNRIDQRFAKLADQGDCALVTYVTAGDPDRDATVPVLRTLVANGADVIELGMPFSDPMADGPVIQRASERALKHGMSLRGVLSIVREFREHDAETPVVLMGYLNPVEAMGYETFAAEAAGAGVDGVLIVDVPPEEAGVLNAALGAAGLNQIFLIAPNSSDERISGVCEFARGFVYYVSVKGVTGGKSIDVDEVGEHIAQFRKHLSLPIGVGFGIKSADAAAAVANVGDAVIVGSAIIEIVEAHADDPVAMNRAIADFVQSLRGALNRSRAA
jgi:tryptophan synthase alpha chain